MPTTDTDRPVRLLVDPPSRRDSLKNGAIIGAIVGAVSLGLLANIGCGVANLLSEPDCSGATIAGIAGGAGLGALVGVGLDAAFERAPHAGASMHGSRKVVRFHLRF